MLDEGSQIIADPAARNSLGHVTSAYSSQTLGEPIALALLTAGRSRIGASATISAAGRRIEAEIVEPVFYDARGERLNA